MNFKTSVLKTWVADMEFTCMETRHTEILDSSFLVLKTFEGDNLQTWYNKKKSQKHEGSNGSKYT